MVGDTIADDIEGARALGMRAILLDRERIHPDFEQRIETLHELGAVLGF
jgi:FMN phosphatase YigB (HAD superfamily)